MHRQTGGYCHATTIPPTTNMQQLLAMLTCSVNMLVAHCQVYFRWIKKISYLTYAYAAGQCAEDRQLARGMGWAAGLPSRCEASSCRGQAGTKAWLADCVAWEHCRCRVACELWLALQSPTEPKAAVILSLGPFALCTPADTHPAPD